MLCRHSLGCGPQSLGSGRSFSGCELDPALTDYAVIGALLGLMARF